MRHDSFDWTLGSWGEETERESRNERERKERESERGRREKDREGEGEREKVREGERERRGEGEREKGKGGKMGMKHRERVGERQKIMYDMTHLTGFLAHGVMLLTSESCHMFWFLSSRHSNSRKKPTGLLAHGLMLMHC